MRVVSLLTVIALAAASASATPQRVRVSPRGTVEAVVDGVRISMEYGRPYARGRVIWGGLVPWGRWWMPGADEATSFVTSAALRVGSLLVPAGTHTIYTWPDERTFLLIINNQTGQFHTVYHPDRDLGRVPMTLAIADAAAEQLTFSVSPAPAGGGVLTLAWDTRAYSVPLAAPQK